MDYTFTKKFKTAKNKYLSTSFAYIVIALIALFMAGYNYFDNKLQFMAVALIFAGSCFINYFFSIFGKIGNKIAEILFAIETIVLCTYLIIGAAGSTGAMWVCLFPVCGVLFFGLKRTVWLCVMLLMAILFIFFFPSDDILTIHFYPLSLRLRIVFFFIAFSLLSLLLEAKRKAAQNELIALQEKYHDLYLHDGLTGVYNRHAFNEFLTADISSEQPSDSGFILIDIDSFKEINDNFGHITGDMLLLETARIISSQTDEKVFRWGGDEFAIFFNNSHNVEKVAKNICEEFAKEVKENSRFEFDVTVSIGAVSISSSSLTPNNLLKEADKCLYQAKSQGKNRVVYKKITL